MSTMTVAAPSQFHLARRMSRLGTETAFEVLVRARALEKQGKKIVHLEIGEPDFDTPRNIVDAGVDALQMGRQGTNGSREPEFPTALSRAHTPAAERSSAR